MGTRWCQFDTKTWKSLSKISTFVFYWTIKRIITPSVGVEYNTWRNIGAHSPTGDHHIGLISSIKRLARAAASQYYSHLYFQWKYFLWSNIDRKHIITFSAWKFQRFLFLAVPVVHKDVWLPDAWWRHPEIREMSKTKVHGFVPTWYLSPDRTQFHSTPNCYRATPEIRKMQCNAHANIFHLAKICKVWRRKFLSTTTRKGFCHDVLDLIMSSSSDIISLIQRKTSGH